MCLLNPSVPVIVHRKMGVISTLQNPSRRIVSVSAVFVRRRFQKNHAKILL